MYVECMLYEFVIIIDADIGADIVGGSCSCSKHLKRVKIWNAHFHGEALHNIIVWKKKQFKSNTCKFGIKFL